MNGPTHMSFGLLFGAVYAGPLTKGAGIGPEVPFMMIGAQQAVSAVAGLLPDMDEPNAMIGRGTWVPRRLGMPIRLLVQLLSLPIRLFGVLLKGVLGHRGGTHSLSFAALMTLALAIPITTFFGADGDWLIWTILAGYLSHLFADMLNPTGVPLMWPLLPKTRTVGFGPKPLRIRTKTPPDPREMLLRWGCAAAAFAIIGLFYGAPATGRLLGLL